MPRRSTAIRRSHPTSWEAPHHAPPGYVYRWLVVQRALGSYEVQRHAVIRNPDDTYTVRIKRGCGSLFLQTVPAEKVYASREAADQRVVELATEMEPI